MNPGNKKKESENKNYKNNKVCKTHHNPNKSPQILKINKEDPKLNKNKELQVSINNNKIIISCDRLKEFQTKN